MSAWDLRCGRWQDVLADVGEVDAVITDPPFGQRTAAGFVGGANFDRPGIGYGSIAPADCDAVVLRWAAVTRWWFVVFSDHALAPAWAAALERSGLYVFAPVPWVKNDAPPRFMGDGPASSTEWITVARVRRRLPKARIRSRPGFYRHHVDPDSKSNTQIRVGGKPPLLMRAIVRDYTEPGDMVVDPFAGGATTLLAAVTEGRRAIGAEMDPATYAKARGRLEAGYTPDLFAGAG